MYFDSDSLRVNLQPAYILQSRKFRETSLLFDALTKDYGKVSLIAKGVRKSNSKTAAMLQPFLPLRISFVGKSDLKTLSHVEANPPLKELKGIALYSGFYLNELVNSFIQYFDPFPEIYAEYCQSLENLFQNDGIEETLRVFELNLMEHIGYGLQLIQDCKHQKPVDAARYYQFDPEQGPTEAKNGTVSGVTLMALQSRRLTDRQVLAEAKKLMRTVIDYHLQGKTLQSRAQIINFIKYVKK